MIDVSRLRIPNNLVLVLPDPDFKTYKNSSLIVSDSPEHQAQHFSIRGRVFGLPEKLIFNGDVIKNFKINSSADFDSLRKIRDLKQESMLYDVEMEIEVGDMVYFQYTEHYAAYKNQRFVETELGDMLMMDYDAMICCHPLHQPEKLRMLNGFILVEPLKKPIVIEEGIEMIKGLGGVFLPVMNDKQRYIRSKRQQVGTVLMTGKKCSGYLDFPEAAPDTEIEIGDTIVYNPAYGLRLEPEYHNGVLLHKKVYRMHRKDLVVKFEFNNEEDKKSRLSEIMEWLRLK